MAFMEIKKGIFNELLHRVLFPGSLLFIHCPKNGFGFNESLKMQDFAPFPQTISGVGGQAKPL